MHKAKSSSEIIIFLIDILKFEIKTENVGNT